MTTSPQTETIPSQVPSGVMELMIGGMTCANCARHVTEAIRSVPEVASATVRLEEGRATVRWQASPNLAAVVTAVKDAGYEARPIEEVTPESAAGGKWSPMTGWRFNVVLGLAATVPLVVCEWLLDAGMEGWFRWLGFALALPVQIFCGARFYQGAWRQLKAGRSNMDTLVALGSGTAFAYSAWGLFAGAPGHLYFMEAAAIITLISLGHWLEARTSARAESSLQALLHLAPATARRCGADNAEIMVPVGELRVDDVVALKPGDQVPVDGEVRDGDSTVDESMLTGESLPADKARGDNLFAGTLNLNGALRMRVTATGEATALAHIIAAVARAQNSRADIQRLGDRVSGVFVPAVLLIALATGLWWGLDFHQAQQVHGWLGRFLWPAALPESGLAAAFIHAAAVLIIACPCAMGLATPVAIMAAANAAARRGILIRDGVALERAGRITAVVFDKTGTLTQGKPAVVKQESFAPAGRPEIPEMKLAAALARSSSHPISQAVAALGAEDFRLRHWEEVRGSGVQAELLCGNTATVPLKVRLGSLRWLGESGVDLKEGAIFEREWSARGGTVLGIAADQRLLGMLAVEDALKPGVAGVIQELRRKGIEAFIVTGDNAGTARAIAEKIGVRAENVFAGARPEQKAEFLRDLRKQGRRAAFVGDGINDAPALEAADLGIAVSRASDVARAAADIILLQSDIQAVPEALELARATLRVIKQNLFWAFFYNVAGIPLAALGFISPILCALAMGLSDLLVIGNALRLLRRKAGWK